MLKFKGKPWEMRGFMHYVIFTYGVKTTIKEITQMLEAINNASM